MVVGHDLDGSVPAGSVKLGTGLVPGLSVEGGIGRGALEETDTAETIANSGVNEVKRSVTTERSETTISKEDTTRAESVGLVSQGGELAGAGVPLRGVSVLAVGELEFSVVLDLVEEDDLAVGHQTSVHSRHTGATLKRDATRLGGARSRAGSRSRNAGGVDARTVLATLTAVSGGVTTVAVHGAAATLGPVTADSVSKLGTTAAVSSGDAGGLRGSSSRGLTKNWLARSSRRRRTARDRGRVALSGLALGRSCVLASVLASVGGKAVAVSGTAVAVR